jgi:hypothetical protein
MIVEPIVKPSGPAWREQTDRHLKPVNAAAPIASFDQSDDDTDPELPPAAPAAPPWPQIFPGL